MEADPKGKVLVAMSGGVDSSLAAYLLLQQGYELAAASMQIRKEHKIRQAYSQNNSSNIDEFCDARNVAAKLGIVYHLFHLEDEFDKEIITPFISSYQKGMTPNPCVECNKKIKFGVLRRNAEALGISMLATGHYARIEIREDGGHLLRAIDRKKDQSYFLYGLRAEELSKTLFPIGSLTKTQVRALAAEAGFENAEKEESQDVCFISGRVKDFIEEIGGKGRAGNIVLKNGTLVGRHNGIHEFTIGQRKGLRVGGQQEPMYVTALLPEEDLVVVGPREDLQRMNFCVEGLSWLSPSCLSLKAADEISVYVQLRSRHWGSKARVQILKDNQAEVHFEDEWVPVVPGQAAVFYDLLNEEVLGGGTVLAEI